MLSDISVSPYAIKQYSAMQFFSRCKVLKDCYLFYFFIKIMNDNGFQLQCNLLISFYQIWNLNFKFKLTFISKLLTIFKI